MITLFLSQGDFCATAIFEPDVTGTVEQLMQYGMMASAIAQASEDIRERIKADLCEAIQGYQTSDGVMIDGAAWMVIAECPT